MLKEQIFQIVDGANFKQGQTSKEATDTILNLFKAEVDKLTVIDDEERSKISNDVAYRRNMPSRTGGQSYVYRLMKAQLQHTKKQLLEGLEG